MKQESISATPIKPPPTETAPIEGAALPALIEFLRQATGEDEAWAAEVRPESQLEADLGIDSLELAVLNQLLREHHGNRVDVMPLLAGLDLDQIIGLTVGDLLGHVLAATGSNTKIEKAGQ